jgi:hypothetical protein
MAMFSSARLLRRIPALLLLPCLLAMGMESTRAPDHEEKADSMTSAAHAQIMRAPTVQAGSASSGAAIALPLLRYALPAAGWTSQLHMQRTGETIALPRSTPSYLSRAPPVTL